MFKTSFVANVVDVLVVVEEKGLIIVVLLEGFIIAHKTEDRTNIYKKKHPHSYNHTYKHPLTISCSNPAPPPMHSGGK